MVWEDGASGHGLGEALVPPVPRTHRWYPDRVVTASHKAIAIARHGAGQGDIPAGADTGPGTQRRALGDTWLQRCELLLLELCACLGGIASRSVPRRGFLTLTLFPWLIPNSQSCLGLTAPTHSQHRGDAALSPKHTAVSGLVTTRALTGA